MNQENSHAFPCPIPFWGIFSVPDLSERKVRDLCRKYNLGTETPGPFPEETRPPLDKGAPAVQWTVHCINSPVCAHWMPSSSNPKKNADKLHVCLQPKDVFLSSSMIKNQNYQDPDQHDGSDSTHLFWSFLRQSTQNRIQMNFPQCDALSSTLESLRSRFADPNVK